MTFLIGLIAGVLLATLVGHARSLDDTTTTAGDAAPRVADVIDCGAAGGWPHTD